jgi:hypothetical protein
MIVFEWLRRGLGLVNRFIGSSPDITTSNCNTLKITVIITRKVSHSHVKYSEAFNYELPVAVSYGELSWTQLNWTPGIQSESELLYDWRFTAKSVRLEIEPLETHGLFFFFQLNTWGHSPSITSSRDFYNILSHEGMGLSFTIAADPRQHIHSRVRVPWDSRLYFTVSDSRLPFLSPPRIRRATVKVFDPRVQVGIVNDSWMQEWTAFYNCERTE